MGRRARDNRPHLKPVEKIELDDAHSKARIIAAVLLLVLGAAALGYGFTQLLSPETGWQTIEAGTSEGANCGDDFVFLYELGTAGSPAAENRAVSALYTDACRKLFQLFHTVESFEGLTNLRDINLHPNETLTVDGALYRAFETVQRYGDRTVYLGPVYARYGSLFFCGDDSQLVDFDPYLSDEVREEYAAVAAFAGDPQSIDLRLLGDNRVSLYVSEEYLAYAQQEEIERFLDFGWMSNAFIADEIARVMVDNGYTCGVISSVDGFVRNLDGREQSYYLNLYDLPEDQVILAASMEYQGPLSLAAMRNFPVSSLDGSRYYRLRDGRMCTMYLDPADGLCKASMDSLVCYSRTQDCAGLALEMAHAFISDESRFLDDLDDKQIQYICCLDRTLMFNDRSLKLTNLYNVGDLSYFAVDMNDPANYSG